MPTIVKDGINPVKQQFRVSTEETFYCSVYYQNRQIVPTSATLTVYKPGTDVVLVDNQAMTIGANGTLTYALSALNNAVLDSNYKAIVRYIYDGAVKEAVLYYDVVRSTLKKVITDTDIVAELPQLKDSGWIVSGTASSGSTTTIVDTGLKRYQDGYFTGGIAGSFVKNESREILGFVSSTGTVTTTAFSASIVPGEKYSLTRSYADEIQRAFEKIEDRLKRAGRRTELVLDSYELREAHIYFSVAEVCKGLAASPEDFYWSAWREYEKKGNETFDSLSFKYDSSGDGLASAYEEDFRGGTLEAIRK